MSAAIEQGDSFPAVLISDPQVVVVGSINLDIVVRAPRHPRPGETILGTGVAEYPGGKGANQAVAAARDGATVRMIARIGGDDRGAKLRDALESEGIDVSQVGVCNHDPTGLALITVDDAGENTIVVVSGANHKIRGVHISDAVDAGALGGVTVLLAQLECPLDVVTRSFDAARANHVVTVLNAAPAIPLDEGVLALVDVLVVNEHELSIVTGVAERGVAIERALRFVPSVVVTLGAMGTTFATRSSDGSIIQREVGAFAVTPVDTTAAGDAFCGVLAVALARGESLGAAVVRANAAGALATTRAGAQPSLPTFDEIESLIAAQSNVVRRG